MLRCIKPAWLVNIPLFLLCLEENLTFEAFWKELLKKEKCFLASLSSWSHPIWIWNREGGGECVALVLRSFKLNVCNMEGSTCSSWGRVLGGVPSGACPEGRVLVVRVSVSVLSCYRSVFKFNCAVLLPGITHYEGQLSGWWKGHSRAAIGVCDSFGYMQCSVYFYHRRHTVQS